ncbi:bifunctional adenosylcobinamide kinase/adenosylcobinamide-phosphate guanylyltransferase [Planococcus sp. ISL-110]|uniref:bifunctional adenosylcobinamide kinase/adenosylcobinamide-phosphate guanylyltransferase n=1 Tax=Planococcus sp. ISL-110 TaxID=2819167 RepID=UPI001BEBFC29|nr:bifunctional adenosylcobinamide kinase/adenosylcobinamide-phosphate guanylyltransferase [Planococcus sp. ISL-110]MBT2570872.1 bifunctional adenosylcobinamide kinase/adenosylcobinamide-phosphate guanylyltransferase [Planococcus sp. ISL-110]
MARGQLIFISGGVRSGKSAYAESIVCAAGNSRKVYLASGQARDEEMKERIERHRQDRQEDGWHTIEQAYRMESVLGELQPNDLVLWDCVTTWLANELYEGWETGKMCSEIPGCMEAKWRSLQKAIFWMLETVELLTVVSNEVLDDFVRDELYQSWLGRIHIWLVQQAHQAIEMENGLAFRRK